MAMSKVYNVRYRAELAELVDKKQVVLGSTSAVNASDVEMTTTVQILGVETKAVTVSNSSSAGSSVEFKSEAAVVTVGDVEILIAAIDGTVVWGETKEEPVNSNATATITIPKQSRAVCDYIGTKAKFNIPFWYTQQDNDGTVSDRTDGVYTVDHIYGLHFDIRFEPL